MKIRKIIKNRKVLPLLIIFSILLVSQQALADPHPGQSVNVAIIGSPGVINGGLFPTSGPAGELGDFSFTNLTPADVSLANLSAYDTVLLNVASAEMGCTTNTLSASAKADLVTFVGNGGKLIIYDSECAAGVGVDYSWLPYPFNTSNPGAMGATGTLTIAEENTLSNSTPADTHFINATALGSNTDAVGDMNVMVTVDPNWCLDMAGTNAQGTTGPVHAYAKYSLGVAAEGLFIYNGLDVDYLGFVLDPANGLRKIWVQELQQDFNPSTLPCGITVVGITLEPCCAENKVGEDHTVTAIVTDLLGNPQPGINVTFEVISGPNTGENGTNMTDPSGQASFTYTGDGGIGEDKIIACFVNEAGDEVCSQIVSKEWIDETPPEVACLETVNPHGKNVPPAGSTTLPGSKGGQNEDGFYMLRATDNIDPDPEIWLTDTDNSFMFGPFSSGTLIKYTEANGAIPTMKKIGSNNGQAGAVDYHIKGQGDLMVLAIDDSGNQAFAICYVPPPPK